MHVSFKLFIAQDSWILFSDIEVLLSGAIKADKPEYALVKKFLKGMGDTLLTINPSKLWSRLFIYLDDNHIVPSCDLDFVSDVIRENHEYSQSPKVRFNPFHSIRIPCY